MTTFYFSHPVFLQHDTGPEHPECAARLEAIEQALAHPDFAGLQRRTPRKGTVEDVQLIHTEAHIQRILAAIPGEERAWLDQDTVVSKASGEAALYAVGAVCDAVDAVFAHDRSNAFCAIRPPGHHAEPDHAMGFCLFNNVAIAAAYARQQHGIRKVAIVDFDVHHGNGTQAAFYAEPEVLYTSIHQFPCYPGSGSKEETGVGNIVNVPLGAGWPSFVVKGALLDKVFPAVARFEPELILISAGFDAHRDDPLAEMELDEGDFAWMTAELVKLAARHAGGRLVSVLEGGYDLDALGRSVAAHVRTLMMAR